MSFEAQLAAYQVLRTLWRDDPERYAVERLGMQLTHQQSAVLQAIAPEGAHVSVRSGHGTGKSAATAAAVWWFLECRNYPKIPCTAPTSHQLRDVLWAELGKWLRKADDTSRKRGDHPRLWLSKLFRKTQDRAFDRSAPDEWYAVARSSSKDNPDALQGFHASDIDISADGRSIIEGGEGDGQILFIIDEASGVFEEVFQVAEGALSSHGARLLMLANPTKTSGYFAESHRSRRGEFTCLHFKSSDSPLVAKDYREGLVRKWGEGSNIVRVRADGEFPKQEADVLISLELTEAALGRGPGRSRAKGRLGVDVARYGDDRSTFVNRVGNHVTYIETTAKQSTMATAGKAVALRRKLGSADICVDEIGIGAGVVDRLQELGEPVIGVNVAKSAPKRSRHKDDAQAGLLRDYLWLEMQSWMEDDEPTFAGADKDLAENLAGELASVKYSLDSSGRVTIESKKQMKARLGHSPDLADALGVTFAPERRTVHTLQVDL